MIGNSSSIGGRLVSASVLRVTYLVAAGLASFLLMPLLVHRLGDRTYGFWSLALSFIFYYTLLDVGLSSAVSQHISGAIGRNERSECRAIFNAALRIQSIMGAVALLVTVALAWSAPLFSHNPADAPLFAKVILILGVGTALGFPARVYGGVLESEVRYDVRSWLAFLSLALRTGFIVWVVLADQGLVALAWATQLAILPETLLQIWFARRVAPWARIESLGRLSEAVKPLLSYIIYSTLTFIADLVRFQIDPLVISALIGLAAVTHYRVAGVFTQYYFQVILSSIGMLLPILGRLHGAGNRAGVEDVFYFGSKLSSCLSVFIWFAIVAWGKAFIIRWMGSAYLDGYLPLVVLSLAAFLDVCQKPSIDILYATFNNRVHTYLNSAEGIINLVASLLLARPLGILGVALGTLIGASIIRIVIQPWYVCKVTGLSCGNYLVFLVKTVARCSCLAAAAIALVSWGLTPNYFWLATSAIGATILYGIGSWLLVLNQSEREKLLSAIRRSAGQESTDSAVLGRAVV